MKKAFHTILFLLLFVVSSWADTAKQIDFLLSGYRHPTTDVVLSGGKVWTFLDGTSTMSSLWTDKDKGGIATNPIILDSAGKTEVYGDNIYKFEIYDSNDVLIETINGLEYKPINRNVKRLSSYDCDLADALTSIGSIDDTYLIIDCEPNALTSSLTITSNITIEIRIPGLITLGAYNLTFSGGALEAGRYPIFDVSGTGTVLGTIQADYIDLIWFGADDTGATDTASEISMALNIASNSKIKLIIPEGTYLVEDPGITISVNDAFIEGTDQTFIKAERTYFVDEGGGVYTVGQGNIFNADTVTNITLKDITIIGGYDTSWGNQDPYANNVPAQQGSNMLFFHDCTNVTLNNFEIKESYSNFVTLTTTHEAQMEEVYGWNQILISGCENVTLNNCKWTESVGEAWLIYNSDKVNIDNCVFDVDYCVSQLDIIYSTNVNVKGSKFLRQLESDSGDLLNISSSYVQITNNSFKHGNLDVGNEYLNREIPLGVTISPLTNIVVSNNTLDNCYITMATAIWSGAGAPTSWVQENTTISDNVISVDLDTRPAAQGTTVLDYTAVKLPVNYDARNISVLNNTAILKGALQSGGSTYNRVRIINGVMGASGYNRDNIAIHNNTIKAIFSNYDPDLINNISGAIVTDYGNWTNLSIKENVIDCPVGITMNRHDSINRMTIVDNDVYSENFLVMPFASSNFDINELDISKNKFIFYNTTRTYDSGDLNARGFGYFVMMQVSLTSDIVRSFVRNNIVYAPCFVHMSNNQTSASVEVECDVIGNHINYIDYSTLDGGATDYQFRFGKSNTANDYSKIRFIENYFNEEQTATPNLVVNEYKILDLVNNYFVGDYGFSVPTDDISGESDSRFILRENTHSNGTFTPTVTNLSTAVTRLNHENSNSFGITVTSTMTLSSY